MTSLLFYKPYHVLSHFTGEPGQTTLKDFIPVPGVYAAGRLDMDSEGLLLLSDDGRLIQRLTDPRFEHPKTYYVQLEGIVSDEALEMLRTGVVLRGRKTSLAVVERIDEPDLPPRPVPVRDYHPTSWIKIELREGRNRQVRRMTAAAGYPTLRLVRVAIGVLTLGNLKPGEWRWLTSEEIARLSAPHVKSVLPRNRRSRAR